MRTKQALFIDGINLHFAAKKLGFGVDFKRLLSEFQTNGDLLRAYYYTLVWSEQGDFQSIIPLTDWLDYNGYTVRMKLAKVAGVNKSFQASLNISMELLIDALEISSYVDHVFIFSGDSDLRAAVEAIQRRGVIVSIVSSVRTQPPICADELRRQADHFVELETLRQEIQR